MMKKLTLLCTGLLCGLYSYAQKDIGSFPVTGSGLSTTLSEDYECIGINPSNLGWFNPKTVHFGLLEFGVNAYSSALDKQTLNNAFLSADGYNTDFSSAQKRAAAQMFSEKGAALDVNIQQLGLAVQLPVLGGIAFNARFRASTYIHLNHTSADILFNGLHATYFDSFATVNGDTIGYAKNPQPVSKLTDGSKITAEAYEEYNLAYGRRLFQNDHVKIYGGVGLKYILSFGIVDIESKGGTLTAFTAITPGFNINYGTTTPSAVSGGLFTAVGKGMGLDIGGSALINDKLRVGLSVNDIGSISYTGNVYQVSDTTFRSTDAKGLKNYNYFANVDQIVGEKGVFKLKGAENRTISLPTNMRLGANYEVVKDFFVGADLYVPLAAVPGNLENPEFSLGGQMKIANFIKLNLGLSAGGNNGFGIPAGITFAPGNGSYEFGIATRDILIVTADANPNASFVFGFLRFGLGGVDKEK